MLLESTNIYFYKSIHWTTEINLPSKSNLLTSLLASLPNSGFDPDRTWDIGSLGKHHTFPDPLNSEENDMKWNAWESSLDSIAQQVQCSRDPKQYVVSHQLSSQWVFHQLTGFPVFSWWVPQGNAGIFLLLSPSRVPTSTCTSSALASQFALSNGFDDRNRSNACLRVESLPPFDDVLGLPRYFISFRMSSGLPHARWWPSLLAAIRCLVGEYASQYDFFFIFPPQAHRR